MCCLSPGQSREVSGLQDLFLEGVTADGSFCTSPKIALARGVFSDFKTANQ